MIKMLSLDVDGTLAPQSRPVISDRIRFQLNRLADKGYQLMLATGRQLHNLQLVFPELADRLYFGTENGSAVFGPGPEFELIDITPMDRKDLFSIADVMWEQPDCEVTVSGANMQYIIPKSEGFFSYMTETVRNRCAIVSSWDEIQEDVIKASAMCPDTAAMRNILLSRCPPGYCYDRTGPEWVDVQLADKSRALDVVCRRLGIAPDEVAAFGDAYNDIPILDKVGQPWIRGDSHKSLVDRYPNKFYDIADTLSQF